jgi:glutamate N-acetyltransferase/amino-acid N-acetyltransferase
VLSTGVIGIAPLEQVADGLRVAAGRLRRRAAPTPRAIMTTDTRPKHCAVRFRAPAGMVTVGGIIGVGDDPSRHGHAAHRAHHRRDGRTGDAAPLLRRVADRSFNAISIDGDTSTKTPALLLASGARMDPSRDGAL